MYDVFDRSVRRGSFAPLDSVSCPPCDHTKESHPWFYPWVFRSVSKYRVT